MSYQSEKLAQLTRLVAQHAPQEGVNFTAIPNAGTYKVSNTQDKEPAVDQPGIVVVVQGRKTCYVGDRVYDYSPGNVLVMFYPMPVRFEIVEASPKKPFLIAGVVIDLGRMAEVLLRMDQLEGSATRPPSVDPSGIVSLPLSDRLLDPFIRLYESLADPRDAAMLGETIVDEIYYRILADDRGGVLRFLLQQRGEIQRISKAVEHIHHNLDKPVSVGELAELVHMSRTSFFENFRAVMQVSPLQYAKSLKLDRAQALLREGKNAREAGFLVGYNSPAQFSREYKRHFGFAPSAT